MKKLFILAVLATIALFSFPTSAQDTQVVYSNNFEGSVGSEWSRMSTDTTPRGGRRFLGQFRNQTVTLNLTNLPSHTSVAVSFDLYIINSWDGNLSEVRADREGNRAAIGPDIWSFGVVGSETLLNTTFTTVDEENFPQAYPDSYPGGNNPAYTGAVERDTLGYTFHGDTVYHLTFTFPHSASSLSLNFSASGLQPGASDESWGLDNVEVRISGSAATTPEVFQQDNLLSLTLNMFQIVSDLSQAAPTCASFAASFAASSSPFPQIIPLYYLACLAPNVDPEPAAEAFNDVVELFPGIRNFLQDLGDVIQFIFTP